LDKQGAVKKIVEELLATKKHRTFILVTVFYPEKPCLNK
jgi:hypothetical protein